MSHQRSALSSGRSPYLAAFGAGSFHFVLASVDLYVSDHRPLWAQFRV